MKKIRFSQKHIPWILLLFTLLAYIPLVHKMGFYWDDWSMLWFKITQGAEEFANTFETDRPFLGNLYKVTAVLLGDSPLQWQIGTVLLRWLVTLAFWWILKQLWPEHEREVFWIALLTGIYPGFKQMPIVYVWLNAFIMLLAYVLSYGMMLKAVGGGDKKTYLLWTIPSVLLYTFCTISTEYYSGLDICRGLILFIFLSRDEEFRRKKLGKRLLTTFLHWLPYLAVLGVFMFWRVFIFQFPSYQPVLLEQLKSKPLNAIWGIFCRIFEDAYTATWGAWSEFFRFPNHTDFSTMAGKGFWIICIVALVLAWFVFSHYPKKAEESEKSRLCWCWIAMGTGLFMVICPGLPYWVTYLPITLSYPFDRFLVAFMFGSGIFMVGLIDSLLRTQRQRDFVLCLFVAMAAGGNLLNANSFRKDWEMQQDFVNQLTARIPSLSEDTLLLTNNNPLSYESDNSLTGLVNLALDPTRHIDARDNRPKIPYLVQLFDLRYKNLKEFEDQTYIFSDYRSAHYLGKPEDVVVYTYAPPACLRVLDPEQHSTLSVFPDSYHELIPLSDPKRLIDPLGKGSTFLQDRVFGKEGKKNWCWYFQKADLARQTEDWETIAAIGDEILPNYSAGEASEYMVYIEAYAHLNRWDDAIAVMQRLYSSNKEVVGDLCPQFRLLFIQHYRKYGKDQLYKISSALNNIGCVAFEDPK